jgi:hypothetical protein
MSFLSEFENFPEERELVGSLLMAYGEIEFALLICVDDVIGPNLDTTIRVLFRVQGEGARIAVSDAILRPAYEKVKLEGLWSCAFGAIKHCKNIRNQYAHCHWILLGDQLYFLNLDQNARESPQGELQPTYLQSDKALLEAQRAYFEYALGTTYFLRYEYEKRVGRHPHLRSPKINSSTASL